MSVGQAIQSIIAPSVAYMFKPTDVVLFNVNSSLTLTFNSSSVQVLMFAQVVVPHPAKNASSFTQAAPGALKR